MADNRNPASFISWFATGARVFLGGLFLYMGIIKAQHPVEFLKLLRQYEFTDSSLVLNVVASALPWFEIFTGALLLGGVGVQGAGLLSLGMLIPFTIAIALRAAAIHENAGTPFCAIRFDCGCGGGEVLICRKLLENVGLILLALLTAFKTAPRLSLRYSLLK